MRSEFMTSTRPYLIRAFYDWIVDNDCTPYIVVNASLPNVKVPQEFVEGGQIVLNIAVSAVNGLVLGDQSIEFQGRFSGKIRHVHAPILSVIAIYAKENGRGMVFAEEEEEDVEHSSLDESEDSDELGDIVSKETAETKLGNDPNKRSGKPKGKQNGRPHLTIVK
jgi:stringent starvation protein B